MKRHVKTQFMQLYSKLILVVLGRDEQYHSPNLYIADPIPSMTPASEKRPFRPRSFFWAPYNSKGSDLHFVMFCGVNTSCGDMSHRWVCLSRRYFLHARLSRSRFWWWLRPTTDSLHLWQVYLCAKGFVGMAKQKHCEKRIAREKICEEFRLLLPWLQLDLNCNSKANKKSGQNNARMHELDSAFRLLHDCYW